MLLARRLRVHTQSEAIVFLRVDSPVCRAEGLAPTSRVLLKAGECEVLATLYQVSDDLVGLNEAGLSEIAWQRLQLCEGQGIRVLHPNQIGSESNLRRRIYGNRLTEAEMRAIVADIAVGRYSEIQISAFLTACAALPLDESETTSLTRVMVDVGERLSWPKSPIVDKHSVGGLPGNRTTPIIVPIVTAFGLTMPKTSSRAITSPAGTADTMETMAPVDLDIASMRRVVGREGGCIAWGGAMRLSPADDVLIRVERVLDLDSEGQLVASVLSKKIAAGSDRIVLDMPVGPTAKVRSGGITGCAAYRSMDKLKAGSAPNVRGGGAVWIRQPVVAGRFYPDDPDAAFSQFVGEILYLDRNTDGLVVEASGVGWIRQRPATPGFSSIEFLPGAVASAALSSPGDFGASADPKTPEWLLATVPFLGRLVGPSSTALLSADPIVTLNQARTSANPLPELPLLLATWADNAGMARRRLRSMAKAEAAANLRENNR